MNEQHIDVIGIPWYEADDYPRIRQVMIDGDQLPDTFEQWLHVASRLEQRYQSQGQATTRALIRPEAFADWCRAHSLNVNAEARLQWANLAARHATRPSN